MKVNIQKMDIAQPLNVQNVQASDPPAKVLYGGQAQQTMNKSSKVTKNNFNINIRDFVLMPDWL